MSAIHNLSIQGIRSFDARDKEVIKFGKPLTLIVGANGCGKTTIIECLKYATTGDLPPNSKNGAFIHDPKINGEVDVRAQVKLAFTNANGTQMIVTRNIQLLKKRTTTTFKTLEGQLVAITNGSRTTLSTRAVDLDQQVPLYLGVPRAILDYVIFCHQEDSLWPLSEPANLKKRFDEIFQAMKFTKALDNLKSIKKDIGVDIKLLKQSVEHFKVDRDRARGIRHTIAEYEQKIQEYEQTVPSIERQLADITEQSDRLFKSNQQFQEVLSNLENLRRTKELLSSQIERIKDSIEPLDMGKDKLNQVLENFSSTVEEKEYSVRVLQEEADEIKEQLEHLKEQYGPAMSESAVLLSKKEKYISNKAKRDTLLSKSDNGGRDDRGTVTIDLEKSVKEAEKRLTQLRNEHSAEQNRLTDSLAAKQSKQAREEQKLSYTKDDASKLRDRYELLAVKLHRIGETDGDLRTATSDLEKYKQRVEEWQTVHKVEEISKAIKTKNEEMLILENDLESIQSQITKGNLRSDMLAKYSLLKKSIEEKHEDLDNCIRIFEHEDSVQQLGISVDDDFELMFKRKYIELQKQLALCSKANSEALASFNDSDFEMKTAVNELQQLRKNMTDIKQKLAANMPEDCSIEEYDEILRDSEESYKLALENLKMHRTTLEFNLKALEVAEKDNCCYLCQRKFDNNRQQSKLLKELHDRTNSEFERTLQQTLDDEKQYMDSLRKLEKDILNLKDYELQEKSLSSRVETATLDVKVKEKTLNQAKQKHSEAKDVQEHLERKLRPIFNDILRLQKELVGLEDSAARIKEELSVYGEYDGDFKAVDELQAEQNEINEKLRKLRKEIGNLQEEKELKGREFNNLVNLVREKTFKVNSLEKQMEEKHHIVKETAELEERLTNVNEIVTETEAKIEVITREISAAEVELNEKRILHSELQETAEKDLLELRSGFMEFKSIVDEIKQYEEVDSIRLQEVTAEIESINERSENLNAKLSSVNEKVSLQSQTLKDSKNEQMNIKLNIELIDLREQLSNICKEIITLEDQNAEAERDKYQEESMRLRAQFEKLSSQNAGKLGEMRQLQNQVAMLTKQLQTEYNEVDEKYQKEWAKLQTKTLVTDDIDTYSKVLDNAIMKYHGLKMEDINRIIDELWKRTYSGTDVDTIKIQSDEVSNSVRGKSYNYRVVMYKQDAALDMRGRCSAGQKVLASIIIRLALSETFGTNCGVITLDEPTTNLDEDNVQSLARSLSNIIEVRKHQKNFQLIVITHDEKFLSHMNAINFTDHFWKVKRDDRQKSEIEMVDISTAVE
ncbi:HCL575Cp [Eremothecium sinecaudum]|uniref:DNA repair protein RAD50 n=1 Tax=Eremothecium sinecaudum TaxID=45286 RepID=A0A120K1Q0_9SACH|nr:HCL575Cp [Eremothecium sinecaudum]AMD19576.1 HCL575Cp [Eremothecium sinecaudum]